MARPPLSAKFVLLYTVSPWYASPAWGYSKRNKYFDTTPFSRYNTTTKQKKEDVSYA
jgi:hypothetical protein